MRNVVSFLKQLHTLLAQALEKLGEKIQPGESAVQRQHAGTAAVPGVAGSAASLVFQISSRFLLWPTLIPDHTEK